MAAPRYCTVTIKVGGANAAIDVTSDLITFQITDTIKQKKADNLNLRLDDASKKYRNTWYIEKGTQIEATLSTFNWNAPGDSGSRDFGKMWVDTIDMNLKPSEITIKATAIDPNLQKGTKGHSGAEGQTTAAQAKSDGDSKGIPVDNEPAPNPKDFEGNPAGFNAASQAYYAKHTPQPVEK